MDCPKCEMVMEVVTVDNIEIDRCSGCKGLWFDQLEKEDMLKLAASEAVDVGSEAEGKEMNDKRDIKCPKCKTDMVKLIDKDQYHIKYESCPVCYGTFFDAGEFADLKEKTVVERFKHLIDIVKGNLPHSSV